MSAADVLYSDVKFTREKRNVDGAASSPAETTYSEVRILKSEPSTELPDSHQQEASNGRSKVTSERAAVLVLSLLLTAAVVARLISYKNIQTVEHLQKLIDERDAAVKNLTGDSCQKCDDGWEEHGGKCYYFSQGKLPWIQSRDACRRRGGDLVKIDSRHAQSFLEQKLRKEMETHEDKFWIGLTDSQEETKWFWADGSPLDSSLTFWSGMEPDNWKKNDDSGEDCVRMGEKSGAEDLKCWFDKACTAPHKRICEKPTETRHLKCV
ncbi:LOW QUALITY PROTEIN: immune-related, lectin-like receptor 4 [Plectropomus leopardus]|uniref:LOW QUALITY PROTEIN: immune-related, lectin-like receptor 4 n=1 Tax=Plectropomus leopardus TaxID=160734 RepID=UPI001C4D2280|nr:LOW QUALITY PROTEIN: immune-related, lectin-like receptor 4 [Plectropomus leopardus]